MSGIFGAMTTGVSGLKGFGTALNHVSENISNVTTLGYKRIETRFSTLLTNSSSRVHSAAGANTVPSYRISSQGLQEQSDISTHLSVTGTGMFIVSDTLSTSPVTSYGRNAFYTRAGDFTVDQDGYLKNGAGYYLQGWELDINGDVVNTSQIAPLRVTGIVDAPSATTTIEYNVNLPANSPSATTAQYGAVTESNAKNFLQNQPTHPLTENILGPNQILIYDALANEYSVEIYWYKLDGYPPPVDNNLWEWELHVVDANGNDVPVIGVDTNTGLNSNLSGESLHGVVQFDDVGTLSRQFIENPFGHSFDSNTSATLLPLTGSYQFDIDFSSYAAGTSLPTSPQRITWNIGQPGSVSNSTTQFHDDFTVLGFSQDGYGSGTVYDMEFEDDGTISLYFDNGSSVPRYKIPIADFANYNGLMLTNGNAYTATSLSGDGFYGVAGQNGLGSVIGNNLERSNVDLADEFTKMIVIQRAYSANSRIVSVADQLLEEITNVTR